MYACKVKINTTRDSAWERFGSDNVQVEEREGCVLLEDASGTELFGWETSEWLVLSRGEELVYAYYDENLNAEFLHIRGGVCLREYREYDGQVDTDQGEDPDTTESSWSDVADYIDEHMA